MGMGSTGQMWEQDHTLCRDISLAGSRRMTEAYLRGVSYYLETVLAKFTSLPSKSGWLNNNQRDQDAGP